MQRRRHQKAPGFSEVTQLRGPPVTLSPNPDPLILFSSQSLLRLLVSLLRLSSPSKGSLAVSTDALYAMGQAASQSISSAPAAAPARCPIDHSASNPSSSSGPAKCPISHEKPAASSSAQAPAQCPIKHDELNPLNQMPTLSQAPASHQVAALPTDRETSTIPRDEGSKWEYPSPQQFYNALVRKGWETPEEHVETMVQIHNFLNEQAWQEILKWERKENP